MTMARGMINSNGAPVQYPSLGPGGLKLQLIIEIEIYLGVNQAVIY